eukprot:TRINITY_DN6257_c3_g1_i1.p1 TRINITY_DN6257_c3_g1~~TRINITY_DN6257_c3_g1_i1.p1  ORF type:complete len:395 (+),score=44.62 TRINITY_DN6257_c3_g1_i1:75-1259(+)
MSKIEDKMAAILGVREEKKLLRKLTIRRGIDFCSNDYLGLGRDPNLHAAVKEEEARAEKILSQTGSFLGSSGSRLLSGNNEYAMDLEREIADFYGTEDALLFNSGYYANMSIVSALPQKEDIVIFDELCHNSTREGLRLGRQSKSISFKHNDIGHVSDILKKYENTTSNIFILVESVYSMEGDISPLRELCDLVKSNKRVGIIVDEAHGTGVYGTHGEGVTHMLGLQSHPSILCVTHTFGKGFGIHGAAVIGSKVLKSYLLNYARPLIYSTSLSLHSLVSIKCAYKAVKECDDRRVHLRKLIHAFRTKISSYSNIDVLASDSPIQAVLVPGNASVMRATNVLQSAGFDVLGIRSPTVPAGTERIRVIIHSHNTFSQIERLCEQISRLFTYNPSL